MNMNPGMLAYIVGLRMDPQFNGRVVELIRFDPDARLVHTRSGAWYDGAAWVVDARHLGFETLAPVVDPAANGEPVQARGLPGVDRSVEPARVGVDS